MHQLPQVLPLTLLLLALLPHQLPRVLPLTLLPLLPLNHRRGKCEPTPSRHMLFK